MQVVTDEVIDNITAAYNENSPDLLTNELYLYANIKGAVISQPIEAIPQRLVVQEEKDAQIMVGEQLFYTKVRIVRDGKTVRNFFGESFSIITQVADKVVKFNYKSTHNLRALTVDLSFILALIDNKSFTYNGASFPFDVDSTDFSNFPKDIMRERFMTDRRSPPANTLQASMVCRSAVKRQGHRR